MKSSVLYARSDSRNWPRSSEWDKLYAKSVPQLNMRLSFGALGQRVYEGLDGGGGGSENI